MEDKAENKHESEDKHAHSIPLDPAGRAGHSEDDGTEEVRPDLAYKRLAIVNAMFFGLPNAGDRNWVLIDAGIPGTAGRIKRAAARRFGKDARPAAIVQTHGHFDHVGALQELAADWDVPVYAHPLEHPYLNGQAAYPPPDPSVGGGLMAAMSGLYPRGPADVGARLHALPDDHTVPFMPGWTWLHVPGHTPGQAALWRGSDKTLIAADAFVTTAQESAYAVTVQKPEMHGPPMYFTPDWLSARISVEVLAALEPDLVITGHGPAMQGAEMRTALHTLARDFDRIAVPRHGRYVLHPATAADGTAYAPPKL
jgi:glyoxylase-like metal-dependent hydrolase (beta-lactamase superfamily II)